MTVNKYQKLFESEVELKDLNIGDQFRFVWAAGPGYYHKCHCLWAMYDPDISVEGCVMVELIEEADCGHRGKLYPATYNNQVVVLA